MVRYELIFVSLLPTKMNASEQASEFLRWLYQLH